MENPKTILSDHYSPETAFVVNDYPYGFRLRCKIRYWLEHDFKKGTRFCSQTTNPKITDREVWNKPKCSTYAYLGGCMYLNEEDHVTWSGLNIYSDSKEAQEWLDIYQEGLLGKVRDRVKEWIRVKKIYEAARDAGKIEIKVITAGPQE